MTLKESLQLVERMGARLSGSRAYGTPRPDSDWDYWMPERQVKRLAKLLTARSVKWTSCFMGSLSWWTADDAQVEVSYLFPRNAKEHQRLKHFDKRARFVLPV